MLGYGFVASAAGINTFDIDWVGAQFLSTDSSLCMIGGSPENPTFIPFQGTDETTFYSSLFGGGDIRETTGRATGLFPYALSASKFTNHITDASQIPHQAAATFTLLKNGSSSALAVSASGGTTGYFTDNTDTVDFDVGDTCANMVVLTSNPSTTHIVWAGAALLSESS